MPSDKNVSTKGTNAYIRFGQTTADSYGMGLSPKSTAGADRPATDPPNG